jgi:hypothetical protein
MRASEGELDATDVRAEHHSKFNGAIEGVPVIDHPALQDRILIVDFAAVTVEEEPTPDGAGIHAAVTGFDSDAARRFVAQNPQMVTAEKPEEQVVEDLQATVRLEVRIAWNLEAHAFDLARAIAVPEGLRR